MNWRGMLALACGLLAATSARAEWLEAQSRHFVLYADTTDAALRRQSVALERLDWGLRRFTKSGEEADIASRKLTVFLVDDNDIRRLCRCTNVGGFYMSRVSGSIAFSGKMSAVTENNQGRLVLFHEYAHHFLLGTYNVAFPTFYSEGFAEFASTMRIREDSAMIGLAAQHRAHGLFLGQRYTATEMFDPALYARLKVPAQFDSFYGRGWLLTHYLTFDKARFGQFNAYLNALNAGMPSTAAATQAFGDLKALNDNVNSYLARSRLPAMTMRYGDEAVPAAVVRRLPPGEAALMDLRMESLRGVNRETGKKLYAKAAPIAARFPDDPVAQGWLAEMAYDAGDDAAAEAAAARAITRDPKSVQGLLYRGMVKLRRAQATKSDAASWNEARRSIVAANRVDPDDAEPLWWFWLSFQMQGIKPAPSALTGLYRAQELAPQDGQVRFAAALSRIEAGELDQAKQLLRPLAYSPHAPADNAAGRMLAALETGKSGAAVLSVGGAAKVAEEDGAGEQ